MNKFLTTELIGKASRLITNNLAQRLIIANIRITTEQWIILQILSKGLRTQKELSDITLKNKASINSLVSNLIKLGFVDKTISKEDKRETIIKITKSGEDIRKRVVKKAATSTDEILVGFSVDEIAQLNNLLIKINNNLT